jgi:hypothetical protein
MRTGIAALQAQFAGLRAVPKMLRFRSDFGTGARRFCHVLVFPWASTVADDFCDRSVVQGLFHRCRPARSGKIQRFHADVERRKFHSAEWMRGRSVPVAFTLSAGRAHG